VRRIARSPLLHFILIGGLLYWATGNRESPPEVLEVTRENISQLTSQWQRSTGRDPSPAELDRLIEQFIDDALLVRVARSLGWDRNDPVVQRRLIQNIRFLDPDNPATDAQVLNEAYALKMETSDIVVHRRLLERMRLLLAERARSREPTEQELQEYLSAHRSKFLQPARRRLTQVHLSRDRRGTELHRDALALVNSLKASGLDPSEALDEVVSKGDPFLLQASLPLWSKRRLGERLGPRFADASFELPVGEWSGPVVSSYGEHAVWVHEVIGERLPAIEQIRDKVKAELHRQWEGEEMREAQKRLRIGAQIRVAGREAWGEAEESQK
jgi:hypothetical protein